jgi:flagellar basal-body rod modification protein FlgD
MNDIASGATGTTNTQQYGTTSQAVTDKSVLGKDTFMKLLVAQIKNQNPLNPADGVEFLSQLAQFTQVEQTMDIRSEVTQIREAIDEMKAAMTTTTSGDTGNV